MKKKCLGIAFITLTALLTYILCRTPGTLLYSLFLVPSAIIILFINGYQYFFKHRAICLYYILTCVTFLIVLIIDSNYQGYRKIPPFEYRNEKVSKIAQKLDFKLSSPGRRHSISLAHCPLEMLEKKINFKITKSMKPTEIVMSFAETIGCTCTYGGEPFGGTLSGGGYVIYTLKVK